ncbi:MAG: DUF4290 domain-containing protein, partial [Flavobacterium sp.]
VKVIANHMKKSYLSWNKDTVTDLVIFEHLYELSGGKLNLLQSTEELLNSNDLIRTNKKISNKSMTQGGKSMIQGGKLKMNKSQKKPFQKNNNNNK